MRKCKSFVKKEKTHIGVIDLKKKRRFKRKFVIYQTSYFEKRAFCSITYNKISNDAN